MTYVGVVGNFPTESFSIVYTRTLILAYDLALDSGAAKLLVFSHAIVPFILRLDLQAVLAFS